jgi:hypothetical protein
VLYAAAAFVTLIIINVIFAPFAGFTPWRIAVLLVYLGLAYFLWRRNRVAAYVGVLVASAGALLLGGATFFLWPLLSDQIKELSGALEVTATMFVPCLLNLAAAVVLGGALLSNNRWRGP